MKHTDMVIAVAINFTLISVILNILKMILKIYDNTFLLGWLFFSHKLKIKKTL